MRRARASVAVFVIARGEERHVRTCRASSPARALDCLLRNGVGNSHAAMDFHVDERTAARTPDLINSLSWVVAMSCAPLGLVSREQNNASTASLAWVWRLESNSSTHIGTLSSSARNTKSSTTSSRRVPALSRSRLKKTGLPSWPRCPNSMATFLSSASTSKLTGTLSSLWATVATSRWNARISSGIWVSRRRQSMIPVPTFARKAITRSSGSSWTKYDEAAGRDHGTPRPGHDGPAHPDGHARLLLQPLPPDAAETPVGPAVAFEQHGLAPDTRCIAPDRSAGRGEAAVGTGRAGPARVDPCQVERTGS